MAICLTKQGRDSRQGTPNRRPGPNAKNFNQQTAPEAQAIAALAIVAALVETLDQSTKAGVLDKAAQLIDRRTKNAVTSDAAKVIDALRPK